MDTQYIYLIVALVLFTVLALVAILRYPKIKMFIKALGASLNIEGETGTEQPQPSQVPSAETKIRGKLVRSTVTTSADGGKAKADIGGDVEKSDILTEA
ncbi:MAG: hypothetical protein U9R05_11380 [Chloroflexota bacterium]|nr:hypothetical protein [Chloroflexota bacterium]